MCLTILTERLEAGIDGVLSRISPLYPSLSEKDWPLGWMPLLLNGLCTNTDAVFGCGERVTGSPLRLDGEDDDCEARGEGEIIGDAITTGDADMFPALVAVVIAVVLLLPPLPLLAKETVTAEDA